MSEKKKFLWRSNKTIKEAQEAERSRIAKAAEARRITNKKRGRRREGPSNTRRQRAKRAPFKNSSDEEAIKPASVLAASRVTSTTKITVLPTSANSMTDHNLISVFNRIRSHYRICVNIEGNRFVDWLVNSTVTNSSDKTGNIFIDSAKIGDEYSNIFVNSSQTGNRYEPDEEQQDDDPDLNQSAFVNNAAYSSYAAQRRPRFDPSRLQRSTGGVQESVVQSFPSQQKSNDQ